VENMLEPGSHFGEIGMLYNSPRSATVEAANYTACISLSRQKYLELLKLYPRIK